MKIVSKIVIFILERIKIVITYIRGFVPKSWNNVEQTKLTVVSLTKWTASVADCCNLCTCFINKIQEADNKNKLE